MSLRRSSRWMAGLGLCCAFLLTSGINRADDPPVPESAWPTNRNTSPEDLAELKALQGRVKQVVDKTTPATVGLLVTVGFAQGAGSGVIVSEDGLVLTAAHVITGDDSSGRTGYEPGREIDIVLYDGKRVKAKTLGVNSDFDSGMVQIIDKGPNDGKWPFRPIAKSADLKDKQWVVSLGHPGGPKAGRPPVARLGRILRTENKEIVKSNCTLVGGDSGGPLFDLDGNVVGIHSRIGLTLNQNIHVPTELFKKQWDNLVAGEVFGKVAKKKQGGQAFLGVSFPDEEEDDAWITDDVDPETPAGKGGMKAGDTITKFDGAPVKSVKQFRELIAKKKPGDVVKLTVRRGTTIVPLSVTLGKKS